MKKCMEIFVKSVCLFVQGLDRSIAVLKSCKVRSNIKACLDYSYHHARIVNLNFCWPAMHCTVDQRRITTWLGVMCEIHALDTATEYTYIGT